MRVQGTNDLRYMYFYERNATLSLNITLFVVAHGCLPPIPGRVGAGAGKCSWSGQERAEANVLEH